MVLGVKQRQYKEKKKEQRWELRNEYTSYVRHYKTIYESVVLVRLGNSDMYNTI